MQAAKKYFFLERSERSVQVKTPQIIRWEVPRHPYIKLNMDGSSISNLGMAGTGGLIHNSSGDWIFGFSLNMEFAMNNMAELGAVRQGL